MKTLKKEKVTNWLAGEDSLEELSAMEASRKRMCAAKLLSAALREAGYIRELEQHC